MRETGIFIWVLYFGFMDEKKKTEWINLRQPAYYEPFIKLLCDDDDDGGWDKKAKTLKHLNFSLGFLSFSILCMRLIDSDLKIIIQNFYNANSPLNFSYCVHFINLYVNGIWQETICWLQANSSHIHSILVIPNCFLNTFMITTWPASMNL